jgi:hypothetical protein
MDFSASAMCPECRAPMVGTKPMDLPLSLCKSESCVTKSADLNIFIYLKNTTITSGYTVKFANITRYLCTHHK